MLFESYDEQRDESMISKVNNSNYFKTNNSTITWDKILSIFESGFYYQIIWKKINLQIKANDLW